MPIQNDFTLPASAQELPLLEDPGSKIFVTFNASADPSTGQPWCPDVRVAIPVLEAAFTTADSHTLLVEEVGQRPGYVRRPFHKSDHLYSFFTYINSDSWLTRVFNHIDGRILKIFTAQNGMFMRPLL